MKMDARIIYTKNMIKETFLNLLDKAPPDKITVTKICENAEINRSTFYKYYTDPYDLMQQLEDETLEKLHTLAENSNTKSMEHILLLILNEIQANKKYYYRLFYRQDIHVFHEKLILMCCQVINPQISTRKRFSSLKEQEWFYYFIIQGCSYILDCWIRDGMPDDISRVAGFIGKMYDELMNG